MLANRWRIMGLVMKMLQIVPRDGTRLYGAMIKKQAEIRRSGRGTFLRAGTRKRSAARWTHVRYKGSIKLETGPSQVRMRELDESASSYGSGRTTRLAMLHAAERIEL